MQVIKQSNKHTIVPARVCLVLGIPPPTSFSKNYKQQYQSRICLSVHIRALTLNSGGTLSFGVFRLMRKSVSTMTKIAVTTAKSLMMMRAYRHKREKI